MTNIIVRQRYSWPEQISVNIAGFCNHAGYEEEQAEMQSNNIDSADNCWNETIKTCRNCGSWQAEHTNWWNEV